MEMTMLIFFCFISACLRFFPDDVLPDSGEAAAYSRSSVISSSTGLWSL